VCRPASASMQRRLPQANAKCCVFLVLGFEGSGYHFTFHRDPHSVAHHPPTGPLFMESHAPSQCPITSIEESKIRCSDRQGISCSSSCRVHCSRAKRHGRRADSTNHEANRDVINSLPSNSDVFEYGTSYYKHLDVTLVARA
jgi:hypothetical protein